MAIYVASTGSNTSPYDTWAKAATTLAAAVTAATVSGDVIYVDQAFTDTISAATIYTFANNVSVICSNDKINEPPQTLGVMGDSNWIGHSSTSYRITLTGGYKVFFHGMTFRVAGASNEFILTNWGDGGNFEFSNCNFWIGTGSAAYLAFGYSSGAYNSYTKLTNCTFRFGHAGQKISIAGIVDVENCSINASGSIPTTLLSPASGSTQSSVFNSTASDWSPITDTLVGNFTNAACVAIFSNCKIGSGVTVLATQTANNKSSAHVYLYNCASGDQHYHMQHYNSFGSTIVDTGIYANDGAKYDGTNYCSWKIVSTANCSYYTPYVSPWIDCYHSGTSAITPSLEILRDGSSTAYQDDEVWAEFSYQGTSGYPLATVVSDRKGLLASAADQTTGALGAGDWTGENATSWFGKLNPTASITPAEIGHLRARVCVGEPSVTVYVDPTIRGRS